MELVDLATSSISDGVSHLPGYNLKSVLSRDVNECRARLVGIISRLRAAMQEEVVLPDAEILVSFRSGKLILAQDSVREYCREVFENPLDEPANFRSNVVGIAYDMVKFLMRDGVFLSDEVCLSPQRFGHFKINRFVVKVV